MELETNSSDNGEQENVTFHVCGLVRWRRLVLISKFVAKSFTRLSTCVRSDKLVNSFEYDILALLPFFRKNNICERYKILIK